MQVDCVIVLLKLSGAEGCVIENVLVAVHPFASVIVQVYVPGASEEAVAAVPPEGVHAYV
jgi:hypothetical protein